MSERSAPDRTGPTPEAAPESAAGGLMDPRTIHPGPERLFPDALEPVVGGEAAQPDPIAPPELPEQDRPEGPALVDPRDDRSRSPIPID